MTPKRQPVSEEAARIGKLIAAARKRRKLTMEQLAEKMHLSHRQQIERWEFGEREPRMSNLMAIADALGVDLAQLLGLTGRGRKP